MKGLERMPILDLRAVLLELLISSRDKPDERSRELQLLAISMTEYLKDAERWQYVKEHYVQVLDADMGEMMPDQFQAWVDARIAGK